MNLGDLLKAQESGIIEKLDEAGIATVFVDFCQDPPANTVPIRSICDVYDPTECRNDLKAGGYVSG